MTVGTDLPDTVEQFLEMALRSDPRGAVRLVLGLLDDGVSSERVIVDVLAAAQHATGERWLRNEWTVADEHVVSGVTQRALDAVANASDHASTGGSVVVACAEGDWHSLPAQMAAEVLRSRGFAVSFLGASTPADHVAQLLERDQPDAVLVTCNLPLFFAGVTRLADAAHRAGIPVIAGGRALQSAERALMLGADAWAPDISSAASLIGSVTPRSVLDDGRPTPRNTAAAFLDIESAPLASAALDLMLAQHPFMARFDAVQLKRTEEDLAFIVRFVAAALLVDDPTVFTEFLDWISAVLVARDVPASALRVGVEVLIPLIADVEPAGGDLAGRAAADFFSAA